MRPTASPALIVTLAAAIVAATGWWLTEQPDIAPTPAAAELTMATPPPISEAQPASVRPRTRLPKLERDNDGLGDQGLHAAISDPRASDLPLRLFRRLSRLATEIVIADATGAGRQRWPRYWGDLTARAEPCCASITIHAAGSTRDPDHREAALARVVWSGGSRDDQELRNQVSIVRLVHQRGGWRPEQPRSNGAGAISP